MTGRPVVVVWRARPVELVVDDGATLPVAVDAAGLAVALGDRVE